MAQLGALLLDLGELGLTLQESAVIAALGKNSVGPGDRMAGERPDDDQRERRHGRPADQSKALSRSPHDVIRRIMSESDMQVKRMVWWKERG